MAEITEQKALLSILRRYSRNEYRFAQIPAIDVGRILFTIRNNYDEIQRKNISIEGKNLNDLENELNTELLFRDTYIDDLTVGQRTKLIHRRAKDLDAKQTKKLLNVIGSAAKIPLPKIVSADESKKMNEKVVDELRSIPTNPISAIKRIMNKVTSTGKNDTSRAFSDYVRNNFKSILSKKELIIYNNPYAIFSKEWAQVRKKLLSSFTEKTGLIAR